MSDKLIKRLKQEFCAIVVKRLPIFGDYYCESVKHTMIPVEPNKTWSDFRFGGLCRNCMRIDNIVQEVREEERKRVGVPAEEMKR